MSTHADSAILANAASEGLLVVSHDVNTMPAVAFTRLSAGEPRAGLCMVPQSLPIAPIIESLVVIWAASELEGWEDQVVFLPFP
jgi:hypothetical protein